MRIALAANGRMGLGLLRALQDSRHEVVVLVRDGRTLKGAWRWLDHAGGMLGGPWTVEGRAFSSGVPNVWLARQDQREVNRLAGDRPDLLLVGNFGLILKAPVLDVPAVGTVNTHWSLLPHHRGPNPSTSVLLHGEVETGLTFHVVDTRIDAGDILDQVAFPIGPDDTATSLYVRACEEAERRVVELVDRIEQDGLVGQVQDLRAGSYHKRVTPEGAVLDFSQPCEVLDRKVRALTSPMARFTHRGRTVYVSAARPVKAVDDAPGTIIATRPAPIIACGEGGLAITAAWTVMPPGPWPGVIGGPKVGERV